MGNLQIKAAIEDTVDAKGSLSGKVATGGRVNAYNAISGVTQGQTQGDELAVDFGGNGLWHWNDVWTYLSSLDATMLENFKGDLATAFGSELWTYDGSWNLISSLAVEDIVDVDI